MVLMNYNFRRRFMITIIKYNTWLYLIVMIHKEIIIWFLKMHLKDNLTIGFFSNTGHKSILLVLKFIQPKHTIELK